MSGFRQFMKKGFEDYPDIGESVFAPKGCENGQERETIIPAAHFGGENEVGGTREKGPLSRNAVSSHNGTETLENGILLAQRFGNRCEKRTK